MYLDELSTGLDPESRRQLWYAVRAAKENKAIILTTHALDEAEMLCDRVAIMARGFSRTTGSPAELRIRFDQGYKFVMTVTPGLETKADEFAREIMPGLTFKSKIANVRSYELMQTGADVSHVFVAIEARKAELGIINWGLSHTTLTCPTVH